MNVPYSGALDPDFEYVMADRPDDPEMRESVNAWLWDDEGAFGMPRIGIEVVADQWDTHDVQLSISFADRRVLTIMEPGPIHDPVGDDGRPRVLGAGPLSFELVEPLTHWRLRVDGVAAQSTVAAQIDAAMRDEDPAPDAMVPLTLEVDLHAAAPPWESGGLLAEARHVLDTQEEGDLMGGTRFEQLFRSSGVMTVGDQRHEISGGGLRIRRKGVRRLNVFWGHCWQSAIFPSGRGFGCNVYPPSREDGRPTFNEGFLYEGSGALVPARSIDPPFLRRMGEGQDVSLTLETEVGTTDIAGETVLSTYKPLGPPGHPMGLTLEQSIVRYSLDGEVAFGMLERSIPNGQLER